MQEMMQKIRKMTETMQQQTVPNALKQDDLEIVPDRGYNNGRRTGCCSIGNCTAAERICSCNGCNAGCRSGNAGVRFDYE